MKSRNREVNIFNMSILDVLCGALGAFCFMMLALFPYYKPTHLSAEDRQSYQSGQQLQKEIQKLRSDLQQAGPRGAAAMMQQIQRTLKSAQSQLAQTQENLSRTRAAMEQAQQQAQQAQQQAQQAQQQAQQAMAADDHDRSQLAMKHPLILQCWYGPDGDKVTIYIHVPGQGTNGKTAPPFDPSREQPYFFSNTTILDGAGSSSWVIGDTVPGDFAVYYRLDKPQSVTGAVGIVSAYSYDKTSANIPVVTLTAAHPYAEAGIIRLDGKGGAKFIPASASGSASASAPVANSPASLMQTPP